MTEQLPKIETKDEYPPNYEKIAAVFDLEGKKPIFAYERTIYNPHKVNVTPDLLAHEITHFNQQGNDTDGWWDKYLTDPRFRYVQEIEAYGNQYIILKTRYKTKVTDWYLEKFADELAGPMYGIDLPKHRIHAELRRYIKAMAS